MNLILHHLRKDIHALRVPLAIWMLVIVSGALPDLLIFQPDYDTARAIDSFRDSAVSMLVGFIVWVLVIARLIQSEPVTGSTSFWLTRPIPKRVYLLSKLSFFVALVLVPGLVPLFVHAYTFDMTAHDLRTALVVILVLQLYGAVCVIWLATYTPSLIYFAGMFCLGGVVLVIENILIAQFRHQYGAMDGTWIFPLVLVGCLLSLVIEHTRRRGKLGFCVGMSFLGVAMIAGFLSTGSPAWTPAYQDYPVGRTVKVDFQPGWEKKIQWSTSSYGNGVVVPAALADLEPAGPIPGDRIWTDLVAARFDVPGEPPHILSNVGPTGFNLEGSRTVAMDLIEARLPGIKLPKDPFPDVPSQDTWLFNLHNVESQVVGKTGTLTLDVRGQVLSMKQLAAIPLNDPRYIARVPGGFIRVCPFAPGTPYSLTLWIVAPDQFPFSSNDEFICVLVDPQTHSGTMLKNGGQSSYSSSFSFSGTRGQKDSNLTYSLDGTEPLDRMVLYIFQYAPEADFNTTLVAPDFAMTPTDKSRH
jgi:hypothetical protein